MKFEFDINMDWMTIPVILAMYILSIAMIIILMYLWG
jgi:hypothetical protein